MEDESHLRMCIPEPTKAYPDHSLGIIGSGTVGSARIPGDTDGRHKNEATGSQDASNTTAEAYGTRPLTSASGEKANPDGWHLAYGGPLQGRCEGLSPSNVRTPPAYIRKPKQFQAGHR